MRLGPTVELVRTRYFPCTTTEGTAAIFNLRAIWSARFKALLTSAEFQALRYASRSIPEDSAKSNKRSEPLNVWRVSWIARKNLM